MSLAGIFLDRDGTLISHVDYLHDPEEVIPLQGIAETLRALREGRLVTPPPSAALTLDWTR
jgi:histidinol phosphatase-like enzyme